nr:MULTISPECIES: PAS domain-containing sensor histidine kinase [unclassified Jannaschia]
MLRSVLWGERREAAVWLSGALVVLGPVLVAVTFLVLGGRISGGGQTALRAILLADLVYILLITGLVVRRVAAIIAARRARSAGSKLHLRLTGVFTGMALVPTILVAVFATITINMGLEGWFSDRVRNALGNSVLAAQAYAQEHRDDLEQDTRGLAGYLNVAKRASFFMTDGDLRQVLAQGQDLVQRGLQEAFVIDGLGEIRARGDRSYLFDFEGVTEADLDRARTGEVVIIEDKDVNEFRALLQLTAYADRFLYVTREVDGSILQLLDETQETAKLYQTLEQDRGRLLFDFGVLYLSFAVILVLAATWAGLWIAERLSMPVGQLAGAAQRVGQGDLDVRVTEESGDDEIAMLGRIFNQMTRQLKGQRDALVETNTQTERRRRLFDSVLGSVTAGVIGLDAEGRIDFTNRSAQRMLQVNGDRHYGDPLDQMVPEYGDLLEKLRNGRLETVQEEVRLVRNGKLENLLVRIAKRTGTDGVLEGYVVAFDDVTDLVSAQRMAAWGDVARRIAHEIKNPLTPIQLSAERVKRRFGRELPEESAAKLAELTDVIVRQAGDLRRIVDEFSKFARMPEPDRRPQDVADLLREIVVLQRAALEPVSLSATIPDSPAVAEIDTTMMRQAFTNLVKNAGEAIETRSETVSDFEKRVSVSLTVDASSICIEIADTGVGLPADRARLFEPYVTTRDKGTGLGLPIVKKIIEDHGGTLELRDADPDASGHKGAAAIIRLPRTEEA